jgi:hypothetical protein
MQDLTYISSAITGGAASDVIFEACRGNEARQSRTFHDFGSDFGVTFAPLANGGHQAAVRDASGTVVAMANVDEFDC